MKVVGRGVRSWREWVMPPPPPCCIPSEMPSLPMFRVSHLSVARGYLGYPLVSSVIGKKIWGGGGGGVLVCRTKWQYGSSKQKEYSSAKVRGREGAKAVRQ